MRKVKDVILKKVNSNTFLKNVLLISGSTVIGQALVLLIYPIISRLYSVSDFGVFQLAQSILSFIIVVGALRFEQAILLPKKDRDAIKIWQLTVLINFVLFFLLLIVLLIGFVYNLKLGAFLGLNAYIYVIPFIFLGAVLYQSLVYLNIRFKEFKVIGKTKIYQSVGNSSMLLGFGFWKIGALGLFIGDFVGRSAGIYNLFKSLFKLKKNQIFLFEFNSIKLVAKRYKNFPLFNALGALLNTAGFALPALFIGKIYGTEVLGLFALVDRVYAAPSALIGQSVSQVFMSEAAMLVKTDVRLLKQKYIYLLKKLALIIVIPTIIILVFGPIIFSLVFGEKWRLAGEFASILAVMQFAGFVVWPLIPTLLILELQRIQLIWETSRIVLMVLGFFACYYYNLGPTIAVFFFGLIMSVFYISHIVISIYALNKQIKSNNYVNV